MTLEQDLQQAQARIKELEAQLTQEQQAGFGDESYMRKIIDLIPGLVFVKDWDGRFVLVNQMIADIFGTDIHSILGKTDADFGQDPDDVKQFVEADRQVMTSQQTLHIPQESITDSDTGDYALAQDHQNTSRRSGWDSAVAGRRH